jgi:predicted dehydrogenase
MSRFLTRRAILRRTAISGAALAAPTWVPAPVLGLNGAVAPSNRVTLGHIGLGGMGSQHLTSGVWGIGAGGFLGRDDTQVLAVCDVVALKRDAARQVVDRHYAQQRDRGTYAGCAAIRDFRELIDRDDIDAVVVATPDHWHAIVTIQACMRGKDVYCEKPISLTVLEGRAIVETARRYGRVVQTGTQSRSNPMVRFACEVVRSGRIGRVKTVRVACGGPPAPANLPAQPVPEGLDWDLWLGPAPWAPYNRSRVDPGGWRRLADHGGDDMTDRGAHQFDIAQWGLGMDRSGPVEILPPDGQHRKLLTFRYADGTEMIHTNTGWEDGVTFIGTEVEAWVVCVFGRPRFKPESIGQQPIRPGEVRLYESDNHHSNFLECVRTRRAPAADAETGRRSATVCHLGNIAFALRRPLRWDPSRERFVDDESANRMLERAPRAPWRI